MSNARLIRLLQETLAPLRNVPAHGNRTLHLHPLVITLVVGFYDPGIRSLRCIEAQTDDLPPGTDLQRMARSTLSDALRVFDPQLLRPIIADLKKQLPHLNKCDSSLNTLLKTILAADGTYFSSFSNAACALIHTKSNGQKQAQFRLNCQFSLDHWLPEVISVSGKDDGSEPDAFARDLIENALYIVDRNFVDFGFIEQLRKAGCDFVLRIRTNAPGYEVVRSLPLSSEDREKGVVSDQIVRLTGRGAPREEFRLVQVKHASKTDELVGLLSSLTDSTVAAHVITHLYSQRWQVELFFRWLKVYCNFDHLLSTSPQGITMQVYCMMIATLLMHVHLNKRISKYTLLAMRRIANGQSTFEQMEQFLARRERERELEKARRARKAAAKNPAK